MAFMLSEDLYMKQKEILMIMRLVLILATVVMGTTAFASEDYNAGVAKFSQAAPITPDTIEGQSNFRCMMIRADGAVSSRAYNFFETQINGIYLHEEAGNSTCSKEGCYDGYIQEFKINAAGELASISSYDQLWRSAASLGMKPLRVPEVNKYTIRLRQINAESPERAERLVGIETMFDKASKTDRIRSILSCRRRY
ncbi:MAG: hypothetical protein V4736_08695 [Bdellovibrionota bacterium]